MSLLLHSHRAPPTHTAGPFGEVPCLPSVRFGGHSGYGLPQVLLPFLWRWF
jgi:hypothetical protein